MLGTSEILIISLVVLVLFGASAIPKFFRSMGKARSEFDKGLKEAASINSDDTEGQEK